MKFLYNVCSFNLFYRACLVLWRALHYNTYFKYTRHIYIYIYIYTVYIYIYTYIHYIAKSIGLPPSNEQV